MNIYPRKTEKAYGQSLKNIYIFDVPASANKQEIKTAVETQFGVNVISIKTLIQSGKAIRASRGKRAHPITINRKDLKKAYVLLAKGDSIKVFEEVKEPETKATKKEKK
jgi:large subunit ribosomal protein L23